jgi:transposase-like protein
VARPKSRPADRALRPPMRSPGRPPVNRREIQQRFWRKISEGLSSEDAAIACGVSTPVGARWFREAGGMSPITLIPPSGRYLSFAEREEIALLRVQRCGVREVARRLGRSPSTISRELRRNAATRGGGLEYRASTAQWHAERRARRPKTAKLAVNDTLRQYVQDSLPAPSPPPTAATCGGRRCAGSVGVTDAVRIGDGRARGARSRSRAGFGSPSLMMSRCGSRRRRSTRRCMSRAAGAAPRADRMPADRPCASCPPGPYPWAR